MFSELSELVKLNLYLLPVPSRNDIDWLNKPSHCNIAALISFQHLTKVLVCRKREYCQNCSTSSIVLLSLVAQSVKSSSQVWSTRDSFMSLGDTLTVLRFVSFTVHACCIITWWGRPNEAGVSPEWLTVCQLHTFSFSSLALLDCRIVSMKWLMICRLGTQNRHSVGYDRLLSLLSSLHGTSDCAFW